MDPLCFTGTDPKHPLLIDRLQEEKQTKTLNIWGIFPLGLLLSELQEVKLVLTQGKGAASCSVVRAVFWTLQTGGQVSCR